jgi:predicted secreted protein
MHDLLPENKTIQPCCTVIRGCVYEIRVIDNRPVADNGPAISMKREIESVLQNLAGSQCTASVLSGQTIIITETWNNATICASLNSSLTIRLADAGRTGGMWALPPVSGFNISDEGIIRSDGNGISTGIPGTGTGIHSWNISVTGEGVHHIVAFQESPKREVSQSGRLFNLIVVVN